MVAKPYVQDAILAGPTKLLARERLALDVHEGRYGPDDVLAVRFPPGVCQAEYRYLAAVTWVPMKRGGR